MNITDTIIVAFFVGFALLILFSFRKPRPRSRKNEYIEGKDLQRPERNYTDNGGGDSGGGGD
jgi:hypothetical protein